MERNSILEFNNKENVSDVLNELLRSGAQKLIHNAVEAELREFMSQHQGVTEDGKVPVIRNGYLPKRQILTGIGQSVYVFPRCVRKMGRY
jgi:putative transposase